MTSSIYINLVSIVSSFGLENSCMALLVNKADFGLILAKIFRSGLEEEIKLFNCFVL